MAMKPKAPARNSDTSGSDKEFVVIEPEDGLQAVQVGLIVNLGEHKKLPKFAKDSAGKREVDKETGAEKVLWPKEGKDTEQRVSVYVDLLTQEHDYGDGIGVKNIRLPLHTVIRGMSEGVNFVTVAPRTPDGEYIKGKPWSVAPTSAWAKIAAVTYIDKTTKVADVMLKADYKNNDHNNIELLLGKPFMYNVEVKKTEKDDKTYVNTKLKSPVPLMKGMSVPKALQEAILVDFEDEDLLEEKESLGGFCKFQLVRLADLRKIVLAIDYPGSKMQAAVQEKFNEEEFIEKAKEIQEKIIETDRDLIEINARFPNGPDGGEAEQPKAEAVAKPVKPKKPEAPSPDFSDFDDDVPF